MHINLYTHDGVSIFPQGTWLLDKAIDALGDLAGTPPWPDIPGFTAAVESLTLRLAEVAVAASSLVTELSEGRMNSWLTDIATFRGDTVLPLLDFLASKVSQVVDLIEAILHDFASVLHLLWANAAAVLAWRATRGAEAPPEGRIRFLADASLLSNTLFIVLILLGGISAAHLAPCRQA